MRSFTQLRRLAAGPSPLRILLFVSLVFLPAVLSALDVPYTAPGVVGLVGGATAKYNGPYVMIQSDFGFFWIDLTNPNAPFPGHVQALSKCTAESPHPDSDVYVTGDCNGISDIHTNGSQVLVRNLSGNCAGGQRLGSCQGPPTGPHTHFLFALGTWGYLGDGAEIGDSTQTADLQGRTWTISVDTAYGDGRHFIWHSSGNPTAPPNASVSATNLSAAGRPDQTNYFGDRWSLRDASSALSPVTGVQWDFNRNSTAFRPDATHTTVGGTINPAYFPCDTNNGGNIDSGAGCFASVGGAAGSFRYSLKATNQYGTTECPITACPAISVSVPQVRIVGFSGGVLNVLTGGNADATTTQGNPTSFSWVFNPGNIQRSGAVVAVPTGANAFTLQVTYAGYTPPLVSGSINQVDLVPAFALSPNPVLINANLTLTNQMQKASGATLRTVEYSITTTPTPGTFTSLVTCPGPSFCSVPGTATVPAPGTAGNYYVSLRYTFTPTAGPPDQNLTATNPFAATNWAPNPLIAISPAPFCLGSCQLTTGTNYSLSDNETILITPHPGALWELIGGSPPTIGSTSDANAAQSWTPTSPCSSCTLKVTVSGVSSSLPVTISNPTGPPPTGPSVTISGPTSLNAGQSGTFTANVSNATGTVSYAWAFDDAPLPQTGAASIQHSWATSGSHSVTVGITAGNGAASASLPVSVVGQPAPLGTFTVSPGTISGSTVTIGRGVAVTFSAAEQYASQWGWVFGDGTLAGGATARTVARTVTKAYASLGDYSGSLQVWGDSTHTTGYVSTPFTVHVTLPNSSTEFTVQNATLNSLTGRYNAYKGSVLTFTASETQAQNWSWDFGDGSAPLSGKTVTHTFSATGSFAVTVTVSGDGVNTASAPPATATRQFDITQSPFQAAIVPGVASLDDGTNRWRSDVSIANANPAAPLTINLAFVPLDSLAPSTQDLSSLAYGPALTIPPGGSWSATDIVAYLNGGNNKGTLVIKYSGGSAPLVSARVTFQPDDNPRNISYGSGIPAYNIDGSGQIAAQSIVPGSSASPAGLAERSTEALEDTISVNKTGTGSGKVTSDPAGIDCGTTCTFSFPSGSTVTFQGIADPGSIFMGFTGCTGFVVGQCYVTGSGTLTAQFNGSAPPGSTTLTVSKAGTGSGTVTSSPAGIDCGSTCSASFASSTSVTLTATAGSGSTFAGWGGACSGTALCVVNMATSQSVTATFTGSGGGPPPPSPSADQVLIGLRSDPRYRFGVTLFNAAGAKGNFRISVTDEESSPLLFDNGEGANHLVAYRDFDINPYQQVYLTNDVLGLNDTNRRYVLKGTRNSSAGTLLAFGTAIDRITRDLVQITDDGLTAPDESGLVHLWVAGASRSDTTYGAHWRTDLRIYNRGTHTRNLYFEYFFSGDGQTEHVAHVNQIPIAAGELLTWDDVVNALIAAKDKSVDLSGSSAGILHIYYPTDAESASKPLIISSRNYDDQQTGTAGSQLAVYTRAHAGSSTKKLSIAGAEDSDRYSSRIGVFTMDPGPVSFRIVALDPSGHEVGSLATALGGTGLHYGQINLINLNEWNNPGAPVTIQFRDINGGRIGAYVFTVDRVTLDTTFIQALPQ